MGRISNPIDTQKIAPEDISRLDILQQFRRYALRNLGKEQENENAGVYQFADAIDDEKLIDFCVAFGPIAGKVRKKFFHGPTTYMLTVAQSMKGLRDSQKKFAAAVELLQQINRNGRPDRASMLKAMQASQMYHPNIPSDIRSFIEDPASLAGIDIPELKKAAFLLPLAKLTLCAILNEFPPQLVPVVGGVVELPRTRDEGIGDALYYPVRLDYIAEREIGTCLFCNGHFSVRKKGTLACSKSCRRALRNQRYWNQHKACINTERRQKGRE